MHGDAGQAWLDELPTRVAGYEHRWAIQVAPPFANLSYNYVAPAVRSDGAQLILKLGMPHPELSSEIAALRHYDGHGSARLTEADPESGALLIGRLLPGNMLLDLTDDDEATLGEVARRRPRPIGRSRRAGGPGRRAQGCAAIPRTASSSRPRGPLMITSATSRSPGSNAAWSSGGRRLMSCSPSGS